MKALIQTTVYFFKKNTAQQSSSVGHFVVKIKTAQIHRFWQQHISLGKVQDSSKFSEGFTPVHYFLLTVGNCKVLKPAHPAKNHRTSKKRFHCAVA